jgi:hypothetical protein
LVQGETALVGLPGRRKEIESIAKKPDPAQAMVAARDPSKSGLTTTTIPVRRGFEHPAQSRPGIAMAAEAIVAARPDHAGAGLNTVAANEPLPVWNPVASQAAPPQDALPESSTPRSATPRGATFPERRPQRLGQQVVPASAEMPIR